MKTLHPDLIMYAYDGIVHHPLIINSLTNDVSNINQVYLQKIAQVAAAEAQGEWRTYVFLHERPYRLKGLIAATKKGLKKNPSEFWALVGNVWTDSENIRQHLKQWKQLWATELGGRRACMSQEDAVIFDSLPEQIEVWRGTNLKRQIAGLSWTLDQEKAIWFAQRAESTRLVATGMVNKRDVLAYFGVRGEREIVSMRVSITSVTDLKSRSI